jgi:hypothetical protein
MLILYTFFQVLWGSKTPGAAQDARDELVLKNKKKVSSVTGSRHDISSNDVLTNDVLSQ